MADIHQDFEDIAPLMNSISEPEDSAQPLYDTLAGAIFWSDEFPAEPLRKPESAFQSMRFVLRYRTTLILETPHEPFEEIWLYAKNCFPNWIGFQPIRSSSSLAKIYLALKNPGKS